jgi:hypothetical protein
VQDGAAVTLDQVAVVRDHRNIRMDHAVVAADHVNPRATQLQPLARTDHPVRDAGLGQRRHRTDIDEELRCRVSSAEGWEPVKVEVVGMLVGHQDRVQPGQLVKASGVHPGIQQQPSCSHLDQHTGLPQVDDLHGHYLLISPSVPRASGTRVASGACREWSSTLSRNRRFLTRRVKRSCVRCLA